ncbi:MAG TPA: prenyltransferase/squalene oxidase repeat-containing protein [Acidimicrobiales bacterium]
MSHPLTTREVADTVDWIASIQRPDGMIPWFHGGHSDPWNHTEAAMALMLGGQRTDAERAYQWLIDSQLPNGTWCRYYLADGVEDPRRDPNVGAYVATGSWWHYLLTGDSGFLESMWPAIEKAIGFVLRLQQPGGEVLWSMDPDGHLGRYALLTSTSSIHHSLRCAVAIAEYLGYEKPEWELAADLIVEAIVHRPQSFAPKHRWAMDWYYPVLSGAVDRQSGRDRLTSRWSEFVIQGVGIRCVADQSWVTAAETAECVMALDAVGMSDEAERLLDWTRHLRDDDGAYWTGCVHPQCVRYPGGERTTYTAAAVLLADHAIYGGGPSSGLFRGETLAEVRDLSGVVETLGDL